MFNYECLMENMKSVEFVKNAFFFQTDNQSDIEHWLFKNEDYESIVKKNMLSLSHMRFLYLSNHSYVSLICGTSWGEIFSFNKDDWGHLICSSFFELPFFLAEQSVLWTRKMDCYGSSRKKSLLNDIQYAREKRNLRRYLKWCKNKDYPLKSEYLNYFD